MSIKSPLTFFIPDLENNKKLPYFPSGIKAGFPSPAADFDETKIKTGDFAEERLKEFNHEKYKVVMENTVKSTNSSGHKRCDIVILKDGEPYIIFPVKLTVMLPV